MKERLTHKIQNYEEEKLKKKACKLSIKEGSAYSIMDGAGLRYMTPYALAMGANNTQIGILASLPMLIGSFSELFALKELKRFPRKTLVFWGVLLQSLMWLAVIGIGALFFLLHVDSSTAPTLLIIAYTLLIAFGTFPIPAWTSWMRDIVPEHYNSYFGRRNRICGSVALVTMLIAGYVLDLFKTKYLFLGFVILFTAAFIGRAISAYLFTKKYEPRYEPNNNYHDGFIPFLKNIERDNFGRFVIFISLMLMIVTIAAPFFAVYMLHDLQLSYLSFTVVSMSSFVMMLLFMPAWGRFSDRYGNLRTLKICGGLIPLVPIIWLAAPFVTSLHPMLLVPYLVIIEGFSGIVWAGFNLASADFIYDAVPRERVPTAVANLNILNNTGAFIGAILGGLISSLPFTFLGLTPILFIFLLSGVLRFVIYAKLMPSIQETRQVKEFGTEQAKQFLHMTPGRLIRILK